MGARTVRLNIISIHAPPRGATMNGSQGEIAYIISIHAPPRGATVFFLLFSWPFSFQFTPLREGRPPEKVVS